MGTPDAVVVAIEPRIIRNYLISQQNLKRFNKDLYKNLVEDVTALDNVKVIVNTKTKSVDTIIKEFRLKKMMEKEKLESINKSDVN